MLFRSISVWLGADTKVIDLTYVLAATPVAARAATEIAAAAVVGSQAIDGPHLLAAVLALAAAQEIVMA